MCVCVFVSLGVCVCVRICERQHGSMRVSGCIRPCAHAGGVSCTCFGPGGFFQRAELQAENGRAYGFGEVWMGNFAIK